MSAVAMEEKVEKPDKNATQVENAGGIWCGIKIPVIGWTGEKGSGKTLAMSSIDPEHTCMVDLEDSSETYTIEFAQRVSLYDEMLKKHNRAATNLECYVWFADFIDSIVPGKFTVLAVDPFSDIQAGLVDWVKANPTKFGHTANQYEKASGLLWADVKQHCKMMLGILSRKVETFTFSTHMGNIWKAGAPTDKRKAKGLDTLFELSSLYVELERKPDDKGKVDKKPSGKVLKSRLAISKFVDGEIEHFPILPPRLPVATPAAIRQYIKNPPNYASLKKGELVEKEVLSDDEKIIIEKENLNTKLEIEQAKLSVMDRLREQTERQDNLRKRQQAAAEAAKKPETKEAAEATESAKPESANATSSTVASAPTEHPRPSVRERIDAVLGPEPKAGESSSGSTVSTVSTDSNVSGDSESKPTVHEIIEAQKIQLGITAEQWSVILKKRNVSSTADLSPSQAEEIRIAMWNKLTLRDAANALGKTASKVANAIATNAATSKN